jgi:hypothetical protein
MVNRFVPVGRGVLEAGALESGMFGSWADASWFDWLTTRPDNAKTTVKTAANLMTSVRIYSPYLNISLINKYFG